MKSQRFGVETQMGKKSFHIMAVLSVVNVGGWIWESNRDRVGLETEGWVRGVYEPPKKFKK